MRWVQSIRLLSAKKFQQKSTQIYDYEISIETVKLMSENFFQQTERNKDLL